MRKRQHMVTTARFGFLLLVGLAFLATPRATAATEDSHGDLRVQVIAGYNLIVDSNGKQAPSAAYLGARYHNDGTTTLTDVFAYIGDRTLNTPGVYPSRLDPGVFTGTLSLTHEGGSAGTADATRYLGDIAPGEFVTVYWLISYPQRDDDDLLLWGDSVKPDDDLVLDYDVWGTGKEDGATPREAIVNRTVTFRNEISAAANKIFPNGANKVPQEYKDILEEQVPSWGNNPENGSPGSLIVTKGIWYDLGNVGEGFDNDGDLVYDRNAWMQPVGDASAFDPSAYRLVKTTAFVVVKLKGGGVTILAADDQLYFEHIPENTGAVGWVGYEYMVRKSAGAFNVSPYQEVASGKDNEKFNADYGAGPEAIPIPPLEATLTKGATATVAVPGTIEYTVDFANTSTTQALGHPEASAPAIIQDSIPADTAYVGGTAALTNTLPTGVTSYTILYSDDNGATWSATEPTPATVTDIQWWLSDAMPTETTGRVTFSVTVTGTPPAVISNTAGMSFGPGDSALEDDATTLVTGTHSIAGTVFGDIGALYGDGVMNGTEAGINDITVTLYYDADGGGTLDDDDILVATELNAAASAYSFTSLAAGNYLVIVDKADGNMTAGYALTSDEVLVVALAGAVTGKDFGFAPALSLAKTLVGDSTVTEGDIVQYTIEVGNELPGDGTGQASAASYDAWPTALGSGITGWFNSGTLADPPTNALGTPDTSYAWSEIQGGDDDLYLTDFAIGSTSGNIGTVELVVDLAIENYAAAVNDTLTVSIYETANDTNIVYSHIYTISPDLASYDNSRGEKVVVVSKTPNWAWSDFTGSTYTIKILASKGSKPNDSIARIYGAGFRVASDVIAAAPSANEILQPVPLTDTYDSDRLEYVSADLAPDTPLVPGILTWSDIGPIYPGATKTVTVSFRALEPLTTTTGNTTNTANVSGAAFQDGTPANDATEQVILTVTAGGSIGDTVWRDVDDDGVRDAEDVGIPGVTVTLTPPSGPAVVATTDEDGQYLFTGLTLAGAAAYTVTVTPPAGSTNTYDEDDGITTPDSATIITGFDPTVVGNDADEHLTADFGYSGVTTIIDGYVWHDTDQVGEPAQETGEPSLAGVEVTLTPGTGPAVMTTTDSDGYYSFTGYAAGTYTITVDNTTGDMTDPTWAASYDTDGSADSSVSVVLAAGGAGTADFSYYQTGAYSIGDTLFYDWDGSGTQDSPLDEGIAGITVYLYEDAATGGALDTGTDTLLATTVTAANGTYSFPNRPAGDYIVVVDEDDSVFPSGYNQSLDPDDTGQGYSIYDGEGAITVSATRADVDFGYTPIGTGSIGDTVFIDANGDDAQAGTTETGIADITVTLQVDINGLGNWEELATAVTDSDGEYLFEDLPDGNYRVIVDTSDIDLPDDAFGNDYELTAGTGTTSVTVSGGSAHLDTDFGFAALASAGDTVYWDTNGDGDQGLNEPGISGVTVYLYSDTDGDGDYDGDDDEQLTPPSEVTDADGNYTFTGLAAGDYVIRVDSTGPDLNGAAQTADPDNDGLPCSDGAKNEDCDHSTGVTLSLGRNFIGADFGYEPTSAIGDTIWLDLDGSDTRDDGELGIPYITVTLDPPAGVDLGEGDGAPITTETDSDGYYSFASMPDGTYTLSIDDTTIAALPGSPSASYERDGGTDHAVTIKLVSGVVTEVNSLPVTDADFELDFGYTYTGSNALSGTVGLDGDPLDGVLNGTGSGVAVDESAFSNQTVYLYLLTDDATFGVYDTGEPLTLIATALTDSAGDYSFTNLPTGDSQDAYIVSLAAPLANLSLTTVATNTPADTLVDTLNASGDTTSAYQVVAIDTDPISITNMDFAFELTLDYDFGDLPQTYSTKIGDIPPRRAA